STAARTWSRDAGRPLSPGAAHRHLDGTQLARGTAVRRHPAHEAIDEAVRLALRVGPQHVVAELVVDGVDPLPLGVVLAPALPVLRMDEMDRAVLVGSTGGLPPVDVLEPGHPRAGQLVEARQEGDRPTEVELAVLPEEGRQLAIDHSALANPRKQHPHDDLGPPTPWARGAENTDASPVSQFRVVAGALGPQTRAGHGFARRSPE